MQTIKLGILLLSISILTSCKNNTEPEVKTVDTNNPSATTEEAEITPTFSDKTIAAVYADYDLLKKALVLTSAEKASTAAEKLKTSLLNANATEVTVMAVQIVIDAKDVEDQRKSFVGITQAVEKMIEGAIKSGAIYKQYCPMAFNNTGAYWLSSSDQIRNPYFGDKMLKCGRIDKEIK
jgi:hypothetical protein